MPYSILKGSTYWHMAWSWTATLLGKGKHRSSPQIAAEAWWLIRVTSWQVSWLSALTKVTRKLNWVHVFDPSLFTITRPRPVRKDATNQNLLRQKLYCLHLQEQESKSKRENGETPSLFKENYPPPRTCHSLIGCSPSAELSSRGRQSTWSGELPLAHAQIICLPLRTQDVSAIL